jgi:hypothetical protein
LQELSSQQHQQQISIMNFPVEAMADLPDEHRASFLAQLEHMQVRDRCASPRLLSKVTATTQHVAVVLGCIKHVVLHTQQLVQY